VLVPAADPVPSDALDNWRLEPDAPDWAGGLRTAWRPGERSATSRLREFLDDALPGYASLRNEPGRPGTSGLSPHLHWGEISPRRIWHDVLARWDERQSPSDGAVESFLSELGWREFSYHLLYHEPELPDRPLRAEFEKFPWAPDRGLLRAWQRGRTGYPIVDAGMRALWTTGWMHNRVRMIAASFLTKHLLQPWQDGAAWFWDCLVDADLAANSASWQWVAGCGVDAAPYFRIFNPTLQGRKFDPDGAYIRRWVPELGTFPAEFIHEPWAAPAVLRRQAVDTRGRSYPDPIVDHRTARRLALEAFATLRVSVPRP
jgi:deoxyribodipyrimidine photo-lyase